ncbi:protein-lysine N-methyltransferase EEF2KMT-like [Babylonia areolata]|uniref:protein-lysine N-methyltransferase EEF2KMT-like n=1 Tax=Babylonia areolata TaxID=304850 RepID=UPI003FD2CF69
MKMAASIDPQMACHREQIEEILDLLSTQFLEMVPIRKMKWKDAESAALVATPQLQQRVLQTTILNPVCGQHPPALSYRTHFMKQLIQKLEQLDAEICDEVYETYTDLLTQKEDDDDTLCYKTYTLPAGDRVSLQESVNLVSQGTTGLSTWQAAQHLAEWIVENPDVLRDKRVVELGCGLGLTGLVACRVGDVKSYVFTDCHTQVLFLLAKNIEDNLVHNSASPSNQTDPRDRKMFRKIKRQLSLTTDRRDLPCSASGDRGSGVEEEVELELEVMLTSDNPGDSVRVQTDSEKDEEEEEEDEISINEDDDKEESLAEEVKLELNEALWETDNKQQTGTLRSDTRVKLCRLDWEEPSPSVFSVLQGDVILGADVVYDPSIIPSLVSLLRRLLDPGTDGSLQRRAYIASTVRNEDTRDAFLIALSSEGLSYSVLEGPKQTLFHYDRMIPIEILQISFQSA